MTKKKISFENGNHAVVVIVPCDTDSRAILKMLDLAQPNALVIVLGGPKELDDSQRTRLAELFSDAIAPAAAELGALIIDGGTQSGVMAMMGEAVARNGRKSQLLGIAPAGEVTYSGGPPNGFTAQRLLLQHF